jgi:hypothetical protein
MIKVKFGWEWMRFRFFRNQFHSNRLDKVTVASLQLKPLGFEFYPATESVIIYVELVIGSLMIKFGK